MRRRSRCAVELISVVAGFGLSPGPRRGFPRFAASVLCLAFLRRRRFSVIAGLRSTGCAPVRLPPFRAARSPGSWFGGPPFGGCGPRVECTGSRSRRSGAFGSRFAPYAVCSLRSLSTLARVPIEEPPSAGALNFMGVGMGTGTQNAFGHTVPSLILMPRRLRKPRHSEGFAYPVPMSTPVVSLC